MATNYPTSLDTLVNPTANDEVGVIDHALQHANANDAIESLQTKVGIDSSLVTTTHDYKLSNVATGDKAVSRTGTETMTNKTLTQPVIAQFYQDDGKTKLMTTPNTASDTLTANAATQSLTNKTITDTSNNVAANSLKTASGVVTVSAATAPTSGQFLQAIDATNAQWSTINTGYNAKTIIPFPVTPENGRAQQTISPGTTMIIGQVVLTHSIIANKISIMTGNSIAVAGSIDITMYTEDGASQIFSITTASLSSTITLYTTSLSSVTIPAGIYYITANSNGVFNGTVEVWSTGGFGGGFATGGYVNGVSGEPITEGTMTITASTPPATITPTSGITYSGINIITFRLDN